MRILSSLILLALLAAAPLSSVAAAGDDWNRLTTATFDRPVQVPGKILPAGIYVFKLAEITGDHNIVQIWNADQTVLQATVTGFPEYLSKAPADDLFIFEDKEKEKDGPKV